MSMLGLKWIHVSKRGHWPSVTSGIVVLCEVLCKKHNSQPASQQTSATHSLKTATGSHNIGPCCNNRQRLWVSVPKNVKESDINYKECEINAVTWTNAILLCCEWSSVSSAIADLTNTIGHCIAPWCLCCLIWYLQTILQIETVTKWSTFRRRPFQMHFLQWKYLNFDSNFTEVCS